MQYNENDIILATVDKIENNITFVHTEDGTKGTIISSEIAPGRIKFMRQYVVPNKKIVCKILKVNDDSLDLSLRRVNTKEKKEVLQEYKQHQANLSALKQILKEEYTKIKEGIEKDFTNLQEFLGQIQTDIKILEKYIPKQFQEQIQKISQKRKKETIITYEINATTKEHNGLKQIQELLTTTNSKMNITYITAGKYTLRYITESDPKTAQRECLTHLESLEQEAKKLNIEYSYKENKK